MVSASKLPFFAILFAICLFMLLTGLGFFWYTRKANNQSIPFNTWNSTITFKDIAGKIPSEIELLASMIKEPERYKRVGASLPKGILLIGPPGTGKTLIAQALAGEVGGNFLYVAASDFVEVYAGTGAKKVRQLFETACNMLHQPTTKTNWSLASITSKKNDINAQAVVIFVDEIDALGIRGSETSENRQTINQMLTCMDGFDSRDNIIVIAATNYPTLVDPALLRSGRFDYIIALPLPDAQARYEILQHYLKDKPFDKDIDLKTIAYKANNLSGADLKALINIAAHKAARERSTIIMQKHLTAALEQLIEKKMNEHNVPNQAVHKSRRRK